MSFFRVLAGGLVILMGAGAAVWWIYGRSVEVSTVAAERGTAAEIVYATGDGRAGTLGQGHQRDPGPHHRDLRLRGKIPQEG